MMTKEEKLNVLNSMFITGYDAAGGVIEYMYVESSRDNINKLISLGVPAQEVEAKLTDDGKEIEISSFAFSYGEAEWYQNEEFLGYTP